MRHTPIEPKHIGCACCTKVGQLLSKHSLLDVGFGEVQLKIEFENGSTNDREFFGGYSENEDAMLTVDDLEVEYGELIAQAECTTLFFNTPLHDETYEYNKEDGEWYLIRQGRGFA